MTSPATRGTLAAWRVLLDVAADDPDVTFGAVQVRPLVELAERLAGEGEERVTPRDIARQRELGWPDFHPEDYCHKCGRPNIKAWHAPEWVELTGSHNGILCPVCFAALDRDAIWHMRRCVKPDADLVAGLATFLASIGAVYDEEAERVARCVIDWWPHPTTPGVAGLRAATVPERVGP